MNFQNPAQSYPKPMASIRVGSITSRKPVNPLVLQWLWEPLTKVGLVICCVVLGINLFFVSSINATNADIVSAEVDRHKLTETSKLLVNEKRHLLTPEQIQIVAAEKLNLKKPSGSQVYKIYR